ncbi:MAG TPA: hypothetical protein VHT51_02560 [Micropepsaceae bacterium]|jgi:vacuolar-type H+-ATPase subunit D/Vma8|nr:hypothetical protein [Micropepsaceae bacterium]
MQTEVFADGISEVNIAAGVVRVNFVSLSATEKDEKGTPLRELRQRIVMTPAGVLELYSAMQQVVEKLIEAGTIQRRPNDAAPVPVKS